jgi:hypothetical protein
MKGLTEKSTLQNSPIFKVRFCITLAVMGMLSRDLAEMWDDYIPMNKAKGYF